MKDMLSAICRLVKDFRKSKPSRPSRLRKRFGPWSDYEFEPRIVPSTTWTWVGANSTSPLDRFNWRDPNGGAGVPGASDTVDFTSAGKGACVVGGTQTVSWGEMDVFPSDTQTITISSGGVVTTANGGFVSANVLAVGGKLNVAGGTFTWDTGDIDKSVYAGTIYVYGNATMHIEGAAGTMKCNLDIGSMTSGKVIEDNMNGNLIMGDYTTITIESSGEYDLNQVTASSTAGGIAYTANPNQTPTIVNHGKLSRTGGSTPEVTLAVYNDAGTLWLENDSTLKLSGFSTNWYSEEQTNGGLTSLGNNSTLTLVKGYTQNSGKLTLRARAGGDVQATVDGKLDIFGGTVDEATGASYCYGILYTTKDVTFKGNCTAIFHLNALSTDCDEISTQGKLTFAADGHGVKPHVSIITDNGTPPTGTAYVIFSWSSLAGWDAALLSFFGSTYTSSNTGGKITLTK